MGEGIIVLMHFGDGSFHRIEVDREIDDPEEAVESARNWVADNAFFEVEEQ